MNQKDLAKAVGVTPQHLNAVLGGRRNPSVSLANSLEEATGISRGVWIFGSVEERQNAWLAFQQRQQEQRERV